MPEAEVPVVEVFVYGTLMPGESAWGILEPFAGSWSADGLLGVLADTGDGYPAMLEALGEIPPREVRGVAVRLVDVTASRALDVLDAYEDVPGGLYERVGRRLSSGRSAWVYLWTGPTDRLTILPGRWGR